jgi:hypothetical protein
MSSICDGGLSLISRLAQPDLMQFHSEFEGLENRGLWIDSFPEFQVIFIKN